MGDDYDDRVVSKALKDRASRIRGDLERIEWSLSRLTDRGDPGDQIDDYDLLAEREQLKAQRAALTPQLASLERAIRGNLTMDNNCADDQIVGRVLMERANAAQGEIDQLDWDIARVEVQRAKFQADRAKLVGQHSALIRAIDAIASRSKEAIPEAAPSLPEVDRG